MKIIIAKIHKNRKIPKCREFIFDKCTVYNKNSYLCVFSYAMRDIEDINDKI